MNLNIIVLLLSVSLLLYYLLFSNKETFIDNSKNKYTSENLLDMFDSLKDAENRCAEIEEREIMSNNREQLRINQATFNELEELDKKILELKEIVKTLSIEKKRRSNITNKCRHSKQQKLNENYDLVKQLNKDDLVKDNSINFEFDLSKFKDKHAHEHKHGEESHSHTHDHNKCIGDSCEIKNPKHYTKFNQTELKNKCYGCDIDEKDVNKDTGELYNSINSNFS